MKLEPRDLWVQALSGGLQAAFLDTLTGYRVIHEKNPDYYLVPSWMFTIADLCLDKPMFGGVPLVPYDTDRVIAAGQYLPGGEPVPGLSDETFEKMMGYNLLTKKQRDPLLADDKEVIEI